MTTPSVDAIVTELAARSVSWERMREHIAAALASEKPGEEPESHLGPYLSVARDFGSGGVELATRVGIALGWPVLDHEIVDLIAAHLHVNPSMMDLLERDAAGWVTDVLGDLMPHVMVTRTAYTNELRRVLQLLAVHGQVIFLGRDANFFLPHERGLSIRVVATLEDRIARVGARTGKDRERALEEIREFDRARAHAVAHTFGCDITDPLFYDVVVNSSWCPIPNLAELIVGICRKRWP